MRREDAVSELVSALLLTAVLVAGAAVILTGLTSQYPPVIIPDPRLEIWNDSKNISIQSTGGDTLLNGSFQFRVIPESGTVITLLSNDPRINNTAGNNNLSTGNTLSFTPSVSLTNARVQVIYLGGSSSVLMYEKRLG